MEKGHLSKVLPSAMSDAPATEPASSADQDQHLETLLQDEGRALLQDRLKRGVLIAIPLYSGFGALDYYVAPDHLFQEFLLIRCAVVALAVVVLIAHANFQAVRDRVRFTSFLVPFAGGLGISLMTALMGSFNAEYYLGLMLTMFMVGLYFPWGPKTTAIFGATLVVGYIAPNILLNQANLASVLLPVFFLGGTVVLTWWSAGAVDIARRKELILRLQLEEANDELMELDQAKTQFFANVSHELRTPLMLILGPLESLLNDEADDAEPLLRAMDSNAHRLMRQVNMILNFSKLEAGQQTCDRELGSVGQLLTTLVEGATPYASGRGIQLNAEGLELLPPIPFDQEKIETVAANLMSNAMKFTPNGGRVTVRAGKADGGIWFEVDDTGCGIPQDQQAKVFERFHQVDSGKNGKIQGTGLGLALSKELVEMHGGRVSVRSTPGQGTTFRVELPDADAIGWTQAASAEAEGAPSAPQRVGAMSTQFADLAKPGLELATRDIVTAPDDAPTLLLVEDNHDMRAFVANSLRRHYKVFTAVDGQDGLETARKVHPDLIVSDVMMPRMDGFEMVEHLRRNRSFDRTPIVMLTARTGAEAVVRGLKLGAVDYVSKPFKMPELLARISAQLRMRDVETALAERDSRLVAVGQMTGSIAHDLRGPLTGIYNRIEMLRLIADRVGNLDAIGEDLDAIESTIKRINGMIQELLDFVSGNRQRLDRHPVDISKWISEVAAELTPTLSASGIELQLGSSLSNGVRCALDPERMQRVIDNLVNNAREAMLDAGTSTPQVRIEVASDNTAITISVSDNGPGIPEDVADSLFQPFATSGKAGGTGLGLAISHNLVVAHGGEISVESDPSVGTCFRIRLPRLRSPRAQNAA